MISQCELWTDHAEMPEIEKKTTVYAMNQEQVLGMVAEEDGGYGKKK